MTQERFFETVGHLANDAIEAADFTGLFKSLIGNEDLAGRFDGSPSLRTLDRIIRSNADAVTMYLARVWGQRPDEASLPTAMALMPDREVLKYDGRYTLAKWISGASFETFDDLYDQIHDDFSRMQQSGLRHSVRVVRSEYLAHRLPTSRDRLKLQREGRVFEAPTFGEIIDEAEAAVALVEKLSYLRASWPRLTHRLERARREGVDFWQSLSPVR